MQDILNEIETGRARLIMVIGRSDSGKTTFVERLAARLSANGEIGIVDSDIGQSHVGPPATVGWGRLERRASATLGSKQQESKPAFPGWEAVRCEQFYFTGAVSPAGNLLQLLTGTGRMTAAALSCSEKVIVDTTGLVEGDIGRSLKQQKIDLLQPDLLVVLQHEDELEPLLAPLRHLRAPIIRTAAVREEAGLKTVASRTAWRRQKFEEYFRDSTTLSFDAQGVGLRYIRGAVRQGPEQLINRLASLRDSQNRDLVLGIVKEVDEAAHIVRILTPLKQRDIVAFVNIGTQTIEL